MSGRRHFRNKFRKQQRSINKLNYGRDGEKAPRIQADCLSEVEVGITEYISDLPGFSGIIKARYSDFHVNEIDLEGKIAKLTDTKIPDDFRRSSIPNDSEDERPYNLISKDVWNSLKLLIESEAEPEKVEMDVTALTKEERGMIHQQVKKAYGSKIVADTQTKSDKKIIEFKKPIKGQTVDNRQDWPKDKGEYVHFLVFKENADTLEACYKISDCLRMRASSFNYAGVKDRRAKTTQWFSVKKVEPWKLLIKTKQLRNIKIGNICFKDAPLKLGQLQGNRFRIALRNVTADDEQIKIHVESLKEKGFINYYGLQRFGNDKEVPTYLIGIKLMQGNWKEASDLILKLKTSDDPNSDITAAKKVYHETCDASKAIESFHMNKNRCVEYKLLEGFSKNGANDYVNALENIPRNMRLLYIHSFQSLVWNKMASRRIKQFGPQVIVGDIVLLNEEINDDTEDGIETDVTDCRKQAVKIVNADEVSKYTIFDVVLPLPGYDIQYPANEVTDWYKFELEQYGLSLDMPKQKVKTYTLSGNYRKVLRMVNNLSWYTLQYNDPNDNLIRSDFEEILGHREPENISGGKYKALIIDFCLKQSCYATMALREVLKMDTSTLSQAKLNDYHEKEKTANSNSCDSETNPNSLLNDPIKFAAFKTAVFNSVESSKRKVDETLDSDNKKLKVDEENSEIKEIKLQPSLV